MFYVSLMVVKKKKKTLIESQNNEKEIKACLSQSVAAAITESSCILK